MRPVSRCYNAGVMSAASVIFAALVCIAMVALFGLLWAALHLGFSKSDEN